ncbi:hypothetical protein MBAV_000922 [Candidatus Magnetobacterium bavaricum]|uniref:Uncharacterized protein n=1 Tax=Candidatus Magnetobacterium bavaricum TaxID=29290 RepID=A0A0F3H1U4_9BACT|nr:hypothetical protein MBAV_000922 [Candidatus Magnetobacterium bavaricum]
MDIALAISVSLSRPSSTSMSPSLFLFSFCSSRACSRFEGSIRPTASKTSPSINFLPTGACFVSLAFANSEATGISPRH